MKRRLINKVVKYSMLVEPNPYGISNLDYRIKTGHGNRVTFSLNHVGLTKLPKGEGLADSVDMPSVSPLYRPQGAHRIVLRLTRKNRYYRPVPSFDVHGTWPNSKLNKKG